MANGNKVFLCCCKSFVASALLIGAAATAAEKQATGLGARHEAGQTLLTWSEVDPPVVQDSISARRLQEIRHTMDEKRKARYRIYRSTKPIKSLDDRFAWAVSWVGVHDPSKSPQFTGSYEAVYGKRDWSVRFEDGTPVWDYFNDAWYLRNHPEQEVGLIAFSNGKNDGAIGWEQAAEFYRALQETRRPHVFVWGQSGHGERARLPLSLSDRLMPMDLRVDQSQPAFTRCSLDDDPGRGDPKDGAPEGQVNLYLFWETRDVVDQPDRWEMTVGLVEAAPKDTCTVNITPRRLQRLKLEPGRRVFWSNTSVFDSVRLQADASVADEHGLVTLKNVRVTKGTNRVVVSAEPDFRG